MKIFLSVPFSSRIDWQGNVITSYRVTIEKLIAGLRERGDEVFCALEHAQWKLGGLTPPEDELKRDFDEIDAADKIIVLLEEQISAGVQLENGYAFAKNKPVVVYQIGNPAWSNIAFSKLAKHTISPVSNVDDFAEQVLSSGTSKQLSSRKPQ